MTKKDGVKLRRMTTYWADVEARMEAGEGFELPDEVAARMPPDKWIREDYVQEVMTKRWGERYLAYRELLQRASNYEVVPDHPIHIDFDLKDSCNLACINCSENYRPWSGTTLDLERLFKDPFFKERKLMSATLGNGTEPFLVPDVVFKLLKFLRAHDVIDIWFHTSGQLLSDKIIDGLIENEVSWVGISMDALTEDTYLKMRGKGFQKMWENTHRLLERRKQSGSPFPLVRVTATMSLENMHELPDFFEYWKERVEMVEFQTFASITPIGKPTAPHVARSRHFEHLTGLSCSQPYWRLAVGSQGDVSPCCMSYGFQSELTPGNIFDGGMTLREVWDSDKMKAIREDLRDGPRKSATCKQCLNSFYKLKCMDG
jgi:radical SAM protein with 4Fe4S-binding SPASM domain